MAQSDLSQQQQDEALLQKFGYKQELRRSLGFISNFAVAFSYISVSTGTFSLFYLGILAGGPAFFWTWPIVAIGQFIVALNFAELSSHFPIAGSIYQWSKRLSGHSLGWCTGWIYFFARILTTTAVAARGPSPALPPFAAALFMSLFVIYGFDTAGTLGEETKDPQRNAPRGVLWAIGLSAIAGFLFLGGTILSIKDPAKIEAIAGGTTYTNTLPAIIQD